MLPFSSVTATASPTGSAILPYCLDPAAAVAPALPCASADTVIFARSSSVIFITGLSSVFAIASFSRRRFLLRLRLLRALHFRNARYARSHQRGGVSLQYLRARLNWVFRYLLASSQRRSQFVAKILMASDEAQGQYRNVCHDPAGPFHPHWFL